MITIPDSTIAAVAYNSNWQKQEYLDMVFMSLKNHSKRDWLVDHAYHCLPIVMGNQHGFVVKSLWDFEAIWNGGYTNKDIYIEIKNKDEYPQDFTPLQSVSSHFGMGVITIQTAFTLRTPKNINLMTINPPNFFIDGLYHMTGVVETDNLRRDFTFNLRITREDYLIKVKKGDYIGCVIPYPRHFIDQYKIKNASDFFDEKLIEEEITCMKDFAFERENEDVHKPSRNGKRYFRGIDIYNNKFPDHQTSLDKYINE